MYINELLDGILTVKNMSDKSKKYRNVNKETDTFFLDQNAVRHKYLKNSLFILDIILFAIYPLVILLLYALYYSSEIQSFAVQTSIVGLNIFYGLFFSVFSGCAATSICFLLAVFYTSKVMNFRTGDILLLGLDNNRRHIKELYLQPICHKLIPIWELLCAVVPLLSWLCGEYIQVNVSTSIRFILFIMSPFLLLSVSGIYFLKKFKAKLKTQVQINLKEYTYCNIVKQDGKIDMVEFSKGRFKFIVSENNGIYIFKVCGENGEPTITQIEPIHSYMPSDILHMEFNVRNNLSNTYTKVCFDPTDSCWKIA